MQALEKIRFEIFTDNSKLDAQPELFIHIIPDKVTTMLTIIDSSIVMTKSNLVNNLGNIAHKLTLLFMSANSVSSMINLYMQSKPSKMIAFTVYSSKLVCTLCNNQAIISPIVHTCAVLLCNQLMYCYLK